MMYTITVPRSELAADEVVQALRDGLGPGYNVLPGMRQTRGPFSEPIPGSPDTIVVGIGSNRVQRAQVTIVRGSGRSEIRVSPGGLRQSSSTRRRAIRLFAGLLLPLIFVVLLQLVGNATKALAITEGIPLLWVIGYAIWRRRIEPVGATAVAGFGTALLLTIALGGSPLPLELHRALFPGAVGLACLISLAARRPLLEIARSKVAKHAPHATAQARPQLEASDAHHALTVLTAIIGVTMSADAAAQVTLALTVSTATFGVAAHIAAWVIIGLGLAVCGLFVRWTVRRDRDRDRVRTSGPVSTPSTEPTAPLSKPTETPR